MKSTLVIITVFSLFILISCNPAKKDSGQTQQVPVVPQNQEQPTSVNTEPAQPLEAEAAKKPSAEQNSAEVMLNPPHGQPYHRCDIPVGSPLNSPPANTTRQTTNSPTGPTIENAKRMSTSQTQTTTAPENKGSKPRLNPPHGQPWHRCDIAVGSPLL